MIDQLRYRKQGALLPLSSFPEIEIEREGHPSRVPRSLRNTTWSAAEIQPIAPNIPITAAATVKRNFRDVN